MAIKSLFNEFDKKIIDNSFVDFKILDIVLAKPSSNDFDYYIFFEFQECIFVYEKQVYLSEYINGKIYIPAFLDNLKREILPDLTLSKNILYSKNEVYNGDIIEEIWCIAYDIVELLSRLNFINLNRYPTNYATFKEIYDDLSFKNCSRAEIFNLYLEKFGINKKLIFSYLKNSNKNT